jgi:transposase-like protein
VCDDNENIRLAADKIFPGVIIQLCHRHYLANLRKFLDTRNDPKYRIFVQAIKAILGKKRSSEELRVVAGRLVTAFKGDQTVLYVLADLEKRASLLFGYMRFPRTPTTTNLIECFNSHLEGRLKTIKGFQSFKNADNWLNAYYIKRRLTPFKDCGHPFKHLNKHCSLEKTLINIEDLEVLKKLI